MKTLLILAAAGLFGSAAYVAVPNQQIEQLPPVGQWPPGLPYIDLPNASWESRINAAGSAWVGQNSMGRTPLPSEFPGLPPNHPIFSLPPNFQGLIGGVDLDR